VRTGGQYRRGPLVPMPAKPFGVPLTSSIGPDEWLSAQMTFITSKYHKYDSFN
jgi:hypothetical protein